MDFFKAAKKHFKYQKKIILFLKNSVKIFKEWQDIRNIAVHDYQAISLDILQKIIENHLEDALELAREILKYEINK